MCNKDQINWCLVMVMVTHESRDIAKPSPWPNVTIRSRARTGPDLRKVAALRALEEKGSCKSCMVKYPKDCTKLSGNLISRHETLIQPWTWWAAQLWPQARELEERRRLRGWERAGAGSRHRQEQDGAAWMSRVKINEVKDFLKLRMRLTTSRARSSCSCRQAWQRGSQI